MDGVFVPNLAIGPHVVRCLAPLARDHGATIEVHLMVSDPGRYLEVFAEAGAAALMVHVEAVPDIARLVAQIRALGIEVGVAINPATPLSSLEELLPRIDQAVVMTVSPGFAGQALLPWTLDKVARLRSLAGERGIAGLAIEADGGVHRDTVAAIARSRPDRAVAGSGVFDGPDPIEVNLERLRAAAEGRAPR
jgi:ribulose-phosphate 3-epimerase